MSRERFVTFYLSAMLINATGKRVQRVEYLYAELSKEVQITVVFENGERMRVICDETEPLLQIALEVTARVMVQLTEEEEK